MATPVLLAVSLLLVPAPVPQHDAHAKHKAAMAQRGNQAMGFEQEKIRHTFTPSDRGGTIQVTANDPGDSQTVAQIRKHLRDITKLFKAGDFSKPLFIHAQNPPGADTLKARRAEIDYRFDEAPAGGKVTVVSKNAEAIAAIHAFLQFQTRAHR